MLVFSLDFVVVVYSVLVLYVGKYSVVWDSHLILKLILFYWKKFGFLGVFVDTNVSKFQLLAFSLAVLTSSYWSAFAFLNPFSINFCGYSKFFKVSCSFFIRIWRVSTLSIIAQSCVVRLYGMFLSVCLSPAHTARFLSLATKIFVAGDENLLCAGNTH